jgi:phosphoserine phosphatase
MRKLSLLIVAAPFLAASGQVDPLSGWKDGPNKKAIVEFVAAVTQKDGPDYVPPEDRVATFDNDGTLWCEKPTIEGVFALEQFRAMLPKHPEWKDRQPFKAILEKDKEHFAHADMEEIIAFFLATHSGMAQAEFNESARQFFATAKHPKFGVLYKQMTFQPMVELVKHLQANGFRVYICSGGDVDTMRAVAQEIYGIPVENIIGTSLVYEAREEAGKLTLLRTAKFFSFNDKIDKPKNIWLRLGKRPILAAGNVRSGGDIAMLRLAQGSKYRSLQLMVNHDDAEREFAYAEKDCASLSAAEQHGWNVVSIKNDWRRVFSFEK